MINSSSNIKAKIKTIKDKKDDSLIYPVTIGEAVILGKKSIKAHIKEIKTDVSDLKDRSIWK